MKKLRFTTAYSILTMIFVMGLIPLQVNAQNVTVKPSTGSMIASVPESVEGTSGDYDVFFTRGGFATWRHEQLCLTMTASDAKDLTSNGQLANPANNLFARSTTNEIELGRGASQATRNSYMNFVLPKGYRFTGYEIVFSRNRNDFGNYDNSWFDNTNDAYTGGTTVFGETNSSFEYLSDYTETITYNANATIDNGAVTIKHEDETGMSNILYFRLTDNNTGIGRMVVTFHSITLYFTPEENYTPAIPVGSISEGVSAVDIPFETGKVDYGPIQRRTYDGQTRVSYSSANIIDMPANLTLYEAESVTGGTHFDGTSGNVVEYKAGSIFDVQGYFRLGGKKDDNGNDVEQVYYVETPTYVVLPDAAKTKNPVGFRIVGAELDYALGTAQNEVTTQVNHFYITYTSGSTTYYLNDAGRFVTDTKTEWELDNNGNVHCGDVYLRASGNSTLGIGNVNSDNLFEINNGHLRAYRSWNWRYLIGSTGTPSLSTNTNNAANWINEPTTVVTTHAYTPAPFKLHVYGKDGVELEDSPIEVTAGDGKVKLEGFNNDAIKFGVEGVGLVRAVLTMQALDPYIDRMDVVCQDEQQPEINMEQTFYADDFTVNGGEFWFYLPTDCHGDNVSISYENLWNHNADETYEGGSAEHNSRFNFVNSEHNQAFTGDNIYNNIPEAAADKASVLERQKVNNIGSTKFHFNNADQMDEEGTGGTLTEYPFTKDNYEGEFYTQEFTVTADDQAKTAYVFTTDETRYNIAPTTAVQHRAYAYYEMIVHVSSHEYNPKVELVKIYENSCVEKNGEAVDKPYYGAIVDALDGNNKHGFASYKAVENAIDNVIDNQADDYGHTFNGVGADQILYVDMTKMKGLYAKTAEETTFDDYKNENLSKNALVFLPSGVTVAYDNFAYKTDGGFRAANNVILTDKTPFYSPYEIQVPSQNYATYTRLITAPSEGTVTKASLILPFTLKVENGLHKNDTDDGFQFNLRTMTSFDDQPEGSGKDGYDYYGNGYFNRVEGEIAPANTPYMVEAVSPLPENSTYSFIAAQKGSNILPTTPEAVGDPAKIQGETVTVGSSNNITNYGTYSGVIIPKENNVFYFNRNKYVSSLNLSDKYTTVKIQPFRTYYEYVGRGAARISMFNVIFDADYVKTGDVVSDDAGLVDGINATSQKAFTITTANGIMNITAKQDVNVNIKSLSGISIANLNMKAGEQQSVNVPSGVYIVNNSKISIK